MPTDTPKAPEAPENPIEERWLPARPMRWETDTSRHGARLVRLTLDVDEAGLMVCYLARNWQLAGLAGLGDRARSAEAVDTAEVMAYFHFDQRLEARVEPDTLFNRPIQRITGLRTPPKG